MNNQEFYEILKLNDFFPDKKPLHFFRDTEHGRIKLVFQPLKRTKYAGEIRYRESVGCRFFLSLELNIPSRLIVTDAKIARGKFIAYLHKRRGNKLIEMSNSNLVAWAPSYEWSSKIVHSTEARLAFNVLFHQDEKTRRQQSLSLDPLNLTYSYRVKAIDPQMVMEIVPQFLEVAKVIKSAGEPPEKLKVSAIEKFLLEHPYLAVISFFIGALVILLVPFLAFAALLILFT